jgi:hypothetical protein
MSCSTYLVRHGTPLEINADLSFCCSCNTPPFRGFDTSRSLAISLSVCPMYNDSKRRVSSIDFFYFFSVPGQVVGRQVDPVSGVQLLRPQ